MIKVLIRYWFASLNQRAFDYQVKKLEELINQDHYIDEDTIVGAKMALVKLGVYDEDFKKKK